MPGLTRPNGPACETISRPHHSRLYVECTLTVLLVQLMHGLRTMALGRYASQPDIGELRDEGAGVLAEAMGIEQERYDVDEDDPRECNKEPRAKVEIKESFEQHGQFSG